MHPSRQVFFVIVFLISAFQLVWAEPITRPLTPELLAKCEAHLAASSRVRSRLDLVLDTLNPSALVMNRVLGVSHRRLAPPMFFMPSEKGLVLGVNGVSAGQSYLKTADFLSGHDFQVEGYVLQTRVDSISDMIEKIKFYYRTYGPIYKLVIAAHGSSGVMKIGGERFNSDWIIRQATLMDTLPKDLFVKDAVVVLVSCSTASGLWISGRDGRKRIRDLFSPLMKNGGKVIAATRYVDPELAHIPVEYSTIASRVFRHLLSCPWGSALDACRLLLSDMHTWLNKTAEIEIPAATLID